MGSVKKEKKKVTLDSGQVPESALTEEEAVETWHLLFPTPTEAKRINKMAKMLTKAELGKRKGEPVLEYLMRVQYCVATGIPLCFINKTYIIHGAPAEMVVIKLWRLRQAFPKAQIVTLEANPARVVKKGTVDGQKWFRVEWTKQKAEQLGYLEKKSVHWDNDHINMLSTRCNGSLCDWLNSMSSGGLSLSEEELKEFELTSLCPRCGKITWEDENGVCSNCGKGEA
jgi:ribosomal protein L37E